MNGCSNRTVMNFKTVQLNDISPDLYSGEMRSMHRVDLLCESSDIFYLATQPGSLKLPMRVCQPAVLEFCPANV